MERGFKKSNGTLQGGSIVYKCGRDDKCLWDDTDLIRLWNAQLEKSKNEEDDDLTLRSERDFTASSDDGTVISSAVAGSSVGSVASSSLVSTAPDSRPANKVASCKAAVSQGPVPQQQDALRGMPTDIRRVVLAYYNAGYEAGYFVARCGRKNKPKKRRIK